MNRFGAKTETAGVVLLLVAALAVSASLQAAIDRRMVDYRNMADTLWLPSGKILKELSLGYDGLLADIYWTRAVQYYGGQRRDQKTDFHLLGPLLDITTDLDPHLLVAYKFGSIFLSQKSPGGAGQPEEAVRLIRKGIQANPEEWRLWHELGFIYYWDLKDYPSAAAAYLEGSKNPHADSWMKIMVAVILQKGGNLETSRFLWTEIFQSAEDGAIRRNALEHLQSLKAAEDIEHLERLTAQFRERTGRWPQSFAELTDQGLLNGIPADPLGFPYRMEADGKVSVNSNSKIRLEEGPSPP